MEARLLRPGEAADYLGLSRSSFLRLKGSPGFPEPVYLGQRMPRWERRALDKYLDGLTGAAEGYDDPDEILGGGYEGRQAQAGKRYS